MPLRLLALLFILLFAVSAFGQDAQCALKLSELPDAPELFGFHLGMTTAQVKTRIPQVKFGRADEFGLAKTSISPDFDPRMDKARFSGVRTISLDFLDDRLTSLWLGYDGTFKWRTVPDFVKGISGSLRLPNSWKPWKVRGQQLRCGDFQMTVSIVAEGPSFRIIDETAVQTIAGRLEAKEERASAAEQGFEPGEDVVEIVADSKARIYYTASCQPAQPIKTEDRVVFSTREEAEKTGYKPAKACE